MSDLRSDGEKKMQALLAQVAEIMSVVNDVALEHGIDQIEFMKGYIHFAVDGEAGHSGPVINDEYWSASTAGCWPTQQMREFLDGPDPKNWRSTSYDDDF